MAAEAKEIRTILAPIQDGRLMLPGSVVAEIVELSDVRKLNAAPDWVIGELNWKDWRVPVISFAMLSGSVEKEQTSPRHRVLVIKSLAEETRTPYIGILISGVPRLSSVTEEELAGDEKKPDHPCVFSEVSFEEQRVLIPDLDQLVAELAPVMAED